MCLSYSSRLLFLPPPQHRGGVVWTSHHITPVSPSSHLTSSSFFCFLSPPFIFRRHSLQNSHPPPPCHPYNDAPCLRFLLALTAGVPVTVFYRYERSKLALAWREWMTKRVMEVRDAPVFMRSRSLFDKMVSCCRCKTAWHLVWFYTCGAQWAGKQERPRGQD